MAGLSQTVQIAGGYMRYVEGPKTVGVAPAINTLRCVA